MLLSALYCVHVVLGSGDIPLEPLNDEVVELAAVTPVVEQPAWIHTVGSMQDLTAEINELSQMLVGSESSVPVQFFINAHPALLMLPEDFQDRNRIARKLLELAIIWNDGTLTQLDTSNVHQAIDLLLLHCRNVIALEPKSIGDLQSIHRSLGIIFGGDPIHQSDASFFFELLYYNPYVRFATNQSLHFNKVISRGFKSDIIRIGNRSRTFALKLFHGPHGGQSSGIASNECLQEQKIMHEIRDRVSEFISIPRIYGHHCKFSNSILMEYIDGQSLKNTQLTRTEAKSVLQEIGNIITRLGSVGIGHFNINEDHIIKDRSGHYWLFGFGNGVVLPQRADGLVVDDCSGLNLPILGTLRYVSPVSTGICIS